jgi:peptidoglycan/LPS O-acetylase OafA/YrhL
MTYLTRGRSNCRRWVLISTLLLEEYKKTTDISLQKFYIRRLLRLSPALLIYVLIFFIAYSLTDKKVDTWAFVTAATYTSNYYQSVVGGELYHMPVWSLAIEEHFYLIFPATLLLLLRNKVARQVTWFFLTATLVVLLWRCCLASAHLASFEQIYHNTDTRLDAPLFGVVLALLMWNHPDSGYSKFIKSFGLVIGIAFIAISVVVRDEYFRMTLRYSFQGFGILMVVGYIVFADRDLAHRIRSVLDKSVVKFIGKIR